MRARGARCRRGAAPLALLAMVRRNRRRYGGYVVHVGMAVLFIGVAASSSFQHESELSARPGQSVTRGRLHDALHAPDGQRSRPRRPGAHRRDADARRGARRHQGRPARGDAAAQRGLLRLGRRRPGLGGPLDRRQRRQPRRAWTPVSRATCGAAIAPDIRHPRLQRIVERRPTRRSRSCAPTRALIAIAVLARAYLQNPPPAAVPLRWCRRL